MTYICSKQAKIDRLWGIFIKHILQMEAENAGFTKSSYQAEKGGAS